MCPGLRRLHSALGKGKRAALPPLGAGSEQAAGLRSLIMVSRGITVFQPFSCWLKECHWTLGEAAQHCLFGAIPFPTENSRP